MSEDLLYKYQSLSERQRIELASISEKLNQHTLLIKDCMQACALFDELRELKKYQQAFNGETTVALKNINASIQELRKRLDVSDKNASEILKNHEVLKESMQAFLQNFSALTQKVNELPFERQMAGLKKDHDYATSELKKTIEKMRADLVVSPAQIVSSNKDLLQKIEGAQLDGANAMSRVNNFDLQIRILEKKIESLGILLKNIDLKQQAS